MKTTILKVPPSTFDLLDLPDGQTLVRWYREDDEFRPPDLIGVFEVDEAGRRALIASLGLAGGVWFGPCGHPLCGCGDLPP